MKPSAKHELNRQRMLAFRDAFMNFYNASKIIEDWPKKKLVPNIEAQKWVELRLKVAGASGAAGAIYPLYGTLFQTRSAGWAMDNFNPITGWEVCANDCELFPPETLITALEAALSNAEAKVEDAKGREKGFTGLIAGFLRWPQTIREAVGGGVYAQKSATFFAVLLQIFTGVISTWAAGFIAFFISRLLK